MRRFIYIPRPRATIIDYDGKCAEYDYNRGLCDSALAVGIGVGLTWCGGGGIAPATFTTTKQLQSWVIKATSGTVYTFLWGDGTSTVTTATGADQTITHNYGSAGTRAITFQPSDPTRVLALNCASNGLIGAFPSVRALTSLTQLHCHTNQLTVLDVSALTSLTYLHCAVNQLTVLDVSALTSLTQLHCHTNQLTVLDVSALTSLTQLHCYTNQLTVLDVSALTSLTQLQCYTNQITTLTIPASFGLPNVSTQVQTNQLPQATVDGVLAAFAANLASRPAVGTLNLSGVGNAAPSAAGVVDRNAIIAHGWTVTTN